MGEPKPQAYIEVKFEVPRLLADAVCNFVIENISSGLILEEEEASAVTGIAFYVAEDDEKDWRGMLTGYLSCLVSSSMPAVPDIEERVVKNTEWGEQYRQSVRPTRIGDDVIVRAPWYVAEPVFKYDLIIEPKMAFGTGSHETTRSCLKIIRENFKPGMRFVDVGCGSGVLSILADKMQASFIKAIDCDITAVENCQENFRINCVSAPAEILLGSVDLCKDDIPYEFVCANIIKSTILFMLGDLVALTADKGILILSGLLDRDESEVSAILKQEKQTAFSVLRDNEWLTYIVHKG